MLRYDMLMGGWYFSDWPSNGSSHTGASGLPIDNGNSLPESFALTTKEVIPDTVVSSSSSNATDISVVCVLLKRL